MFINHIPTNFTNVRTLNHLNKLSNSTLQGQLNVIIIYELNKLILGLVIMEGSIRI